MAEAQGISQGYYGHLIRWHFDGGDTVEAQPNFVIYGYGEFTSSGYVEFYNYENRLEKNEYNNAKSAAMNAEHIQSVKDWLTSIKKELKMSDSALNELFDLLPNIQVIYTNQLIYSPAIIPIGEWTDTSMSDIFTPVNATVGTVCDNIYNSMGAYRAQGNVNGAQQTWTSGPLPMSLFNILSLAIDDGRLTVSDDLADIINSQYIAPKTEQSFVWDVYINAYKSNPLIGGYKTESILVRWSSAAVNKATTEYLTENPDYPYRADNTLIRLSTKKQGAGGFSDNFYTGRYGDLETKIPIQKLTETAGVSSFMQTVSAFIPSLDVGDVTLYLRQTFEDLSLTDTCTVQIPVNKAFANVDNLKTTNGKYGSIVRLHWGDPESGVPDDVVGWNDEARDHFDDDVQKYDDDSSDVESDVAFNSNISLLTTTYAMNESNLKAMGQKLWDASFIENIKLVNNSPIENILSVKSFPFPITGGAETSVVLGNVDMGVNGNKIPSTFIPRKTIGTFTVPKKFSGHLEWLNWHTVVTCYLPYIGFVELETKQILDKSVTLKYIYDVITGVCTACFYANNIEIAKYSGTIAIDIPITASNRAQVEAGYIRSALGALGSLAAGNLLGAAANGFGALTAHNSFTTKGSPSPSCDGFDEQKAFIIIDYPVYQEPTNFGHEYGYPCNLSLTLGNLSGFTQLQNVDVTGLAITENEREELKSLLESGIYL